MLNRPLLLLNLLILALSTWSQSWADPLSRGIVDVHVHTGPKHYALLDDVLTSFGVTRFINLSGGQPGFGLDEALGAAQPFDGRIKVCATIAWREIEAPRFFQMQQQMLRKAKELGASCLKISKALGLYIPDPTTPTCRSCAMEACSRLFYAAKHIPICANASLDASTPVSDAMHRFL